MKDNQTIDRICAHIKRKIMTKETFPGCRLVEEDLAAELGVSRTPLRQAFAILQSEGFVNTIPNRGTYVIQPTYEEIVEVYQARMFLEQGLLADVFETLQEEKLDAIRENYEKQMKLGLNFKMLDYSILNREFHILLASLSKNVYLKRFVMELYNRIFVFLVYYDNSVTNNGSILTHGKIVKALEEREKDALMAALREDADLGTRDIGRGRNI